jgi:RNA polymerase sigma-70 factor, ECF subfamily
METEPVQPIAERIEAIYRSRSRRIFATLVRLLGDFELAEEALHDAFRAALEQWPRDGMPANPPAWLVSTGRFKGIDRIRRNTRYARPESGLPEAAAEAEPGDVGQGESVDQDLLRLIFTCCHPALTQEARVALTLREVCGLTTEEIARAFLIPPAALAQRIVRAKNKIRAAGIPYRVPDSAQLPERLDAVLQIIYLVFNEGYAASSGETLTRPDLSGEAIRLGRLMVQLQGEPESHGLLALMLLHESRRAARISPSGDVILLEDQDRSLWNRDQIAEGLASMQRAWSSGRIGPYTVQAAIAAAHARAPSAAATDWGAIVALYDLLLRIQPSPVVALNRAVAVAMRDGPQAGLRLIDAILDGGALADYHLAHAARADLYRRLGRIDMAQTAYERALSLARLAPERRFLAARLRRLHR